jgi:hypothetical protein
MENDLDVRVLRRLCELKLSLERCLRQMGIEPGSDQHQTVCELISRMKCCTEEISATQLEAVLGRTRVGRLLGRLKKQAGFPQACNEAARDLVESWRQRIFPTATCIGNISAQRPGASSSVHIRTSNDSIVDDPLKRVVSPASSEKMGPHNRLGGGGSNAPDPNSSFRPQHLSFSTHGVYTASIHIDAEIVADFDFKFRHGANSWFKVQS